MRLTVLPAVVGLALVFGACGKDGGSPAEPGVEAGPSPTFTNVFRGIILGCAQSQCHGAGSAGGLRLDGKKLAYDNLVGKKAMGPCITDAGGGATDAGDAGPNGGATVIVCGCAPSGKTRVVAGKPEESLLVEKLAAEETCGERMPPTGEPLPQEQRDMVTEWIRLGANYD